VTITTITCPTGALGEDITPAESADAISSLAVLKYDTSNGQYLFGLKLPSPALSKGCYRVRTVFKPTICPANTPHDIVLRVK
jgi:hypothetical protein